MTEKIRVIIAEDEPNYRRALRRTLEVTPDIEMVGLCADGQEAFDLCMSSPPDVVLVDLVMPHMSGLELISALHERMPNVSIVVLTVQEDDSSIYDAFRAGAVGYILKTSTPQEVIEAIRFASKGEAKITPRVARRLIEEFRRVTEQPGDAQDPIVLSQREQQILQCIAAGMRNREIAQFLDIAEKTVKNHVSSILKILQVETRTEAALKAVRHRLVSSA